MEYPANFQQNVYVDLGGKALILQGQVGAICNEQMVKEEVVHLVDKGTLEPAQFASWAAPIAVVLKMDKSSVCICADFHRTVSNLDQYPIIL